MLISESNKNGTQIELRIGVAGNGATIYVVQTERIGTNGQKIFHSEKFSTQAEAENWIEFAILKMR